MSRRRILILFLSFLVTLIGATYFVLYETGATRRFVQELIGQTIRQELIHLETAEIDLTAGKLTVRNFRLENPETTGDPNLLSVKKVEVDVETNPLAEVGAIRKVSLDGLQIHLSLAPGETPDLSQILHAAGVGSTTDSDTFEFPAITVTNSTVFLRVAPNRPTISFRNLQLTILPMKDEPEQLELRGTMISPLGHEIELQGGGNFAKQEFRAMMVARDIPIKPAQATVFREEAADFLDAAKVTGLVKKTVVWMELGGPVAANGNDEKERFNAGVSVEFENLSVVPPQFPYEITDASGNVFASTADNGTIKFLLEKKAVDGDLEFTGKVTQCFLGTPHMDLELEAEDLLIGSRLEKAIDGASDEFVREVQQAFRVSAGRINAKIQVYNETPGAELEVAADIVLNGISARFFGFKNDAGRRVGFPYAIHNVHGQLGVRPGVITIQDLEGKDEFDGRVTINGRVDFTGAGAQPDLDIQGKAIQFSDSIRDALATLLPDTGGEIYEEFSPRGSTDLSLQLKHADAGLEYTVLLSPLLASAAYKEFPYRIHRIRGDIKIAKAGVWVNLNGRRMKSTISIDGQFLGAPHSNATTPRSELWIKATGIPFDAELHSAARHFSPNMTTFWDFVQPQGQINCEVLMWQDVTEQEFEYDVSITVQKGSVELRDFPVPMEHVAGDLFLHGKGNDCRCDISPLRGDIANSVGERPAKVLIQGTIHSSSAGLHTDITSIIRRLRLTPELGAALSTGGLVDTDFWDKLKLDGYVDILAHQHKKPEQKTFNQLFQVRLRDISSQAAVLPGKAHDLHGEIIIENGRCRFDRIEGMMDETRILFHSGTAGREDAATVVDFRVNADSFPVDARLASVLSGSAAKTALSRIRGRAKLDEVKVSFRFPDAGDAFETEFEGDIAAHDLFVDVGLPGGHSIKHLTGVVGVRGSFGANGGKLTGTLKNVGFEVVKQQIYEINSRFEITAEEITLHDLSFTVAGGMVEGNGPDKLSLRYQFADAGRLSAFVTFHEVSLNHLLRDRGFANAKVRGSLSGLLKVEELVGNNLLDMKAGGEIIVSNGRLGTVPLFAAIYSHMKQEKRPQFSKGKVEFTIADQKIKLTHLNARSDLIKLVGRGELGMDGYMDIKLEMPGLFGSAADILIFPSVINWTVSKMVSFRVYGYIREPKLVWTWSQHSPRQSMGPIAPVRNSSKH